MTFQDFYEIYDIYGMTCASCQAHVSKAISKLKGVDNYNVNLSAEIKFECGAQESFKLVKKENKCLYKFVYYTKLGCNTNKMEEMFNKINSILDNV